MLRRALLLAFLAGMTLPPKLDACQWRGRVGRPSTETAAITLSTSQAAQPDPLKSGLYGSVIAAIFSGGDTDATMEATGNGYAWGLSFGYRPIRHLGLEAEFLYFEGDYEKTSDSVLPGAADNDVNMASVALSMLLRASYPVWKLRPFVGGGVGFVDSDLYTKNASSGLFENVAGGQAPGWRAFAGVGLPVQKGWHVDIGWRWIHVSQDFGLSSDVDVNVGGNMLSVAISGGY